MRTARYTIPTIALHWLTVLLIIAVYCTMEFRSSFERGSPERELMKTLHYMLGLTVLGLTAMRIWFRSRQPYPMIEPVPPVWQHKLAALVHVALYALLIGLPLCGWLILSAEGKVIPFWGLELPALIGPNEELAGTLEDVHELLAEAGYALIGLHTLAAIYHHHVVKDNTLLRMKLK